MSPEPNAILPPLAERMRPRSLDACIGQQKILGADRLLSGLLRGGSIPSLILWGPPGSGKTTIARILASSCNADFVFFSAVLSGVADIRKIVARAEESRRQKNRTTILFVDEIHRFNKSQQDAFLPHVENGLLTLIGATTENPSFQVIAPLLSRCRVVVMEPLTEQDLQTLINRALTDTENGLGGKGLTITQEAIEFLVRHSDGDARRCLNSLEVAAILVETLEPAAGSPPARGITLDIAEDACQQKALRYDKNGEEHYNLISALHKSLRDSDPDGGLYWLARMLAAGEDPLYIARRLIRFASEDIGIADPHALPLTIACRESYQQLGSPEGELALAQAAVYLATAPKSNAVYRALQHVMRDIKKTGSLSVPLHIRNAPTGLMKDLGYGAGYQYAHDAPDALVFQSHLPEEIDGRQYYFPTTRGYEKTVHDRLVKWRKILADKKQKTEQDK